MFDFIYQWIENIAFYLVILTVGMQMVPNGVYKKYIQFFSGLILVILLMGPIFKIFGVKNEFEELFDDAQYQQKIEEIEEATKYLEDFSVEVR